jgi:hypothetical protein
VRVISARRCCVRTVSDTRGDAGRTSRCADARRTTQVWAEPRVPKCVVAL